MGGKGPAGISRSWLKNIILLFSTVELRDRGLEHSHLYVHTIFDSVLIRTFFLYICHGSRG